MVLLMDFVVAVLTCFHSRLSFLFLLKSLFDNAADYLKYIIKNAACSYFLNLLKKTIDFVTLIKKLGVNFNSKSWFDSDIISATHKIDKLYQRY